MRRLYLDACVVIYLIEKSPDFFDQVDSLINELTENDSLCYSLLTRMESLVMPLRDENTILQNAFERFFSSHEILEMPVEVFDKAASLRADFPSLRTPDAPHLATALHHGCNEFWTNDDRLNSVAPSIVKNVLEM